ncbi:putative uncharacterized protein DDB_G0279653 isoform X2 [Leptidea sinapis]|uniref:putative uncharacterized protein DDB_G0279653 isoform X2 n=1 Tax=Leptidea sinapis TaxID=189913 RepID=UPI0021C2CF9F|nr:putative uncharacterized protein DDB_G0279653 isoform X2 [Leptidea sinapis]
MGKSSKKVKSDRINALRKQYDAFLEEDKKRKDRNEFILGCLDKVSSRSFDKSVSMKAITSNTCSRKMLETPTFDHHDTIYKDSVNAIAPMSMFSNKQVLLKELSKDYILIPKTNIIHESNIINLSIQNKHPDENKDSDWRTKYNILDELKQTQKEIRPEVTKEEDKIFSEYNDRDFMKIEQKTNDFIFPEKDIDGSKSKENYEEIKTCSKFLPSKEIHANSKNKNFECVINNDPLKFTEKPTHIESLPNEINSYVMSNLNVTNQTRRSDGDSNVSEVTEPGMNKYQSNQKIYGSIYKENETNQEQLELSKVATKSEEQEFNTEILLDSKHNIITEIDSTIESNLQSLHLEPVAKQQPEETAVISNVYAQEINPQNESTESDIPDDVVTDLKDVTGESENDPNNYEQHIEDTITTRPEADIEHEQSQIEEYENEQRNLFYSESADENYIYNEETAHPENVNNEQYSYYEAVKDQPAYAAEIDEHLETNERYDPNYEQQYDNVYQENQYQQQIHEDYITQEDNLNYERQQYEVYEGQEDPNLNYNQPMQQNYENQNSEQSNVIANEEQQQIQDPIMSISNENEMNIPQSSTAYIPQSQVILTETLANVEQQLDVEDEYIEDKANEENDDKNLTLSPKDLHHPSDLIQA